MIEYIHINGCRLMANKKSSVSNKISAENKIREYMKVFAGDFITPEELSLYLKFKQSTVEKVLNKLVQENLLVKTDNKKLQYKRISID